MAQDTMHISIEVADWDLLSAPETSLVNFFMKDAAAYFHGIYVGQRLDFYTGNVCSTYRTHIDDGDSTDLLLNIAISNGTVSNVAPQYACGVFETLPCIITSLEIKNSTFAWCSIVPMDEDAPADTSGALQTDGTCTCIAYVFSNSVTLTPVSNTTNFTMLPAQLIGSGHVETFNAPIVLASGQTLTYDFQLKTDNFKITTLNGQYVCYYKIGITPLNNNTVSGIKSLMLTNSRCSFMIGHSTQVIGHENTNVFVFCIDDSLSSNSQCYQNATLSSTGYYKPVIRSVIPITVNDTLRGLAYIELFDDATGNPITDTADIQTLSYWDGSDWSQLNNSSEHLSLQEISV